MESRSKLIASICAALPVALIGAASLALAADESPGQMPVNRGTPVNVEKAAGDTMQMTCAQARAMVRGKNGVVLKTGANQFDEYHRAGGHCDRENQDMSPALVRTKDNPLCFIGYTCDFTQPE